MASEAPPWDFTADQRYRLSLMGVTPESIPRLVDQRRKLYEETLADLPSGWDKHLWNKYGIDHICTCLDDRMMGRTIEVPRCAIDTGYAALEKLEEVLQERDRYEQAMLDLRNQVVKLGDTPVA